MKKIIALILACLMLFSVVMVFTSCDEEPVDNDKDKEKEEEEEEEDEFPVTPANVFEKIDAKFGFSDKVSYVLTKAEDTDEMIMMQYGIVDMEAADHLEDYVITMPGDYCNTFAMFVFDEELSDEALAELKDTVKFNYTEARASALQMYMPEEYAKMSWACENEDLTWKVYGNVVVFVVTGDAEATDVFAEVEKLVK